MALATKIRLALEKSAKDKHTSLRGLDINYDDKKFYYIGPRTERKEKRKKAS